MSIADSPNSSFETEDTIKMNSSIISSPPNGPGFALDQYYEHNVSFAPPPAIHTGSTPSSFSSASPPSSQTHTSTTTLQQQYLGNDYSLPNSSYYSIFSNSQAMNSVNSLHDLKEDVLHTDLMYNLQEFEMNPSLDSIPDTMYGDNFGVPASISANASAYDLHYKEEPVHDHVPLAEYEQYAMPFEEFRPPPIISLKNMPFSNSSPNLGMHKISKKPSLNLGGVKKSLLDTSSPQQRLKYKTLDLHSPTRSASGSSYSSDSAMPPLNTFRHNSEMYPYYDTPRRKASVDKQLHMQQLQQVQFQQFQQPPRRMSDETKPKKYTRRRLLPRSKNGCWICRIKHLKCDEKRPICSSCSKFGIECDYSPTKPDYVVDKTLRKEKLLTISLLRKQKSAIKKGGERLQNVIRDQ